MSIPSIVSQHFEDPYHHGSCDSPSHWGEAECVQSGCRLVIELSIDPATGLCTEAWFDGAGCVVCEGLASILVERLEQGLDLRRLADWGPWAAESEAWDRQLRTNLLETIGVPSYDEVVDAECMELPFRAWLAACLSGDEDSANEDWPHFGGPSLGEEA
ncbi:MAG: hypothetical protein D6753_18015 [Planctomycetota bacterium]|nr:MAG: hypothetical protein D6753_18015 [Planctomycetota bacterium]